MAILKCLLIVFTTAVQSNAFLAPRTTPVALKWTLGAAFDDDGEQMAPLSSSTSPLPSSSSDSSEYRSISDYMGGHHAGKYDFHTNIYGVTSINYEKSVVFDNAFSAEDTEYVLAALPEDLASGPLPRWASRPVDILTAGSIELSSSERCSITNDEQSWEPFFCSIENQHGTVIDSSVIKVWPESGHLAPRGGRQSYSDKCAIQLQALHELDGLSNETMYLVVRTEMDAWVYKIGLTNV